MLTDLLLEYKNGRISEKEYLQKRLDIIRTEKISWEERLMDSQRYVSNLALQIEEIGRRLEMLQER